MKSVRNRFILLAIILGLAVYYLYPTFRYNQLSEEENQNLIKLSNLSQIPLDRLAMEIYRDEVDFHPLIEAANIPREQKDEAITLLEYTRGDFLQEMKKMRPKAIKLGLDLQGGMYLVLEVDMLKMLDNEAKSKDQDFTRLMTELRQAAENQNVEVFEALRQIAAREHISLNRYWGETGQSDNTIISNLETAAEDAVDRSLQILRNRVDQFGVAEPSITKLGTRRIALELPGVKDPVRARELVGRTALLEFKIVIEPERSQDILTKLDAAIAARAKGGADTTAAPTDTAALTTAATDSAALALADTANAARDTGITKAEDLFGEAGAETALDTSASADQPLLSLFLGGSQNILVPPENRSRVIRMISAYENQPHIPSDVEFLWSSKSETGTDGREMWLLYLVKKQAEMTGTTLEDAQATIGSGYDPEQSGRPVVNIRFNHDGARTFSRVTGANVGRRLAIVLDNKVYMAPNIKDKIPGGSAVITGLDDMPEARDIGIVLRAGALPAPVHSVEERTIGPSLGQDSVSAGQLSLIISFLAVVLFMVWYYRASGLIADLAMIFNVFLLMAVLAMFQFTLTMPGIAGIILTIGMAVDANVLIFERIREELRLGKSVRAAIDTGFTRALLTIVDSNVTTAIAGVVLLIYGTGAIKGFALTLVVGIVINIFTAVFLTRLVYDMATRNRQLKTLSV
ncbi:MAG: protein translocase subunit SecD [bacterium]|nr:protein translocase subunit SecD [bacterium]